MVLTRSGKTNTDNAPVPPRAPRPRSKSPFGMAPLVHLYNEYNNVRGNVNIRQVLTQLEQEQPVAAAATAMNAFLALQHAAEHLTDNLQLKVKPKPPNEKLVIPLEAYDTAIQPKHPLLIGNPGTTNEMVKISVHENSLLGADRTYTLLKPGQSELFLFGLQAPGVALNQNLKKWHYRLHIKRKRIDQNDGFLAQYDIHDTRSAQSQAVRAYWTNLVDRHDGQDHVCVQVKTPGENSRALTWPDN